ncbi:aminotransferase class I/II-fold pyridoxal phosphate-dependent enzyme [Staphylococcus massiliensis]|uniref:Aminotransferase class I/classII large domain-containing protein n=1 Tax=Staphylococcus massiliensis S46 TaxID=1229783 RepID=K9AVS7_9STAP|nr:aminotransferase class I/II-fold pyridoxal phosphate-dependent enzyme [Staphylococcus massiliensis]EKU45595.1 hypothetical protein C273_10976 [Staphylococcus massiliensis S46]MCG3399899.1 aminotransferase class I/II-fold pyridoxal phosphate-dependent enzyme [Staphylococcus massiliensis]MCG3402618.1 aminotransferase class I/II-fold pyridoxal phosphate-dependent enzyme [Staphylococcus massiliensis]PNZ98353.1 aspartate aminotransferase [Staphylococcus massiliensis CCUG 55927]
MNPIALELNEKLKKSSPKLLDMFSDLGSSMYYPKGILSQSADAKATKYNATIGMATNDKGMMYADDLYDVFNHLPENQVFPYAPPQGLESLRTLWLNKFLKENPDLNESQITKPIATNALTHGLSLVGDLFVDHHDMVLLPEHNWGNYNLIFGVRHNANMETFPIFNEDGSFTTEHFLNCVQKLDESKVILLLNYPNNPTGYTPTKEQVDELVEGVRILADRGTCVITVVDDAYYGLFYEDVYKQSIFTALTQLNHENVLPIRLDGATKEFFAWGFRVGFITFGLENQDAKDVMEAKVKGLIRSNISSGPMPSQAAITHVLENNEQFDKQIEANVETLRERYEVTKEVVYRDAYKELWQPYDFNSGYFMALRVHGVKPETLRNHLIEKYSIGIIALNKKDIRIAFSCIEKDDIEYVFETIAKAIKELQE